MKVLKNCHCANFRVCSKRQVFCHLFSWTCCIKVWNYWLKKQQLILQCFQYKQFYWFHSIVSIYLSFTKFICYIHSICFVNAVLIGKRTIYHFCLQYCLHVVYECRQHPRKPDIMSCI